jgi:hypothetical protein
MNKFLGTYVAVLITCGLFITANGIKDAIDHKGPMFVVDYDESCQTLCAKVSFGNKSIAMTREEYRQWQIKQAAGESL